MAITMSGVSRRLRSPFRARFLRARDGAMAVEFALVSPLLFLLLIGLIDLALMIWSKHSLEFAMEETGRATMTQYDVNETQLAADLKARLKGVSPSSTTVTAVKDVVGTTTFVTFTVSYTYNFIFASYLGVSPTNLVAKTRVPINPPPE